MMAALRITSRNNYHRRLAHAVSLGPNFFPEQRVSFRESLTLPRTLPTSYSRVASIRAVKQRT